MDSEADAGVSNRQKDQVTSGQDGRGPATFRSFSELPIEIRLQIWSLALQVSRVVDLKHIRPRRGTYPSTRFAQLVFYGGPPPSMLLVNREARGVALRFYTLQFRARGTTKPATYFNASYDTLRISDQGLRFLEKPDLESITSMIIDTTDYSFFAHYNMEYVRACTTLQDLEMVATGSQLRSWHENAGAQLAADFRIESAEYPEWHMPNTRIVDAASGELLAAWEGGCYSNDNDLDNEALSP